MQRMPASLLVALILAGVLVVTGALVILLAPQASASFGWFAYQPLSDAVFFPGGFIVLTQTAIVGGVLAIVGLIGLAAVVGFALGRRRRVAE
jgi:hypothetical protein